MNIFESFKVAISSILGNKMRSFLTMLGIIIGISSVITIVSIGQGGQEAITGQFQKIGVNILEVKLNTDERIADSDYFTLRDAEGIKDRIPEVQNAAPVFQKSANIRVENKGKRAVIVATNQDYSAIGNLEIKYGRFINPKDVALGSGVVLIDDLSAKALFGYEDCTGKTVKIENSSGTTSAVIIGVFKNENGPFAASFSDNMPVFLYAPITYGERIFLDDFRISQIEVLTKSSKDSEIVGDSIVRVLNNMHHTTGKYKAESFMKQLDEINKILNIFTTIIGAIAGISLLVGGIGVMNIMLVSVTERTREIGIRKAIGATRRDILIQFLIESLIISLIGGIIGMMLGISAGYAIGTFLDIAPKASLSIILIAFLFSSAVGIFFGIYPANKASKLDPIEALRYE